MSKIKLVMSDLHLADSHSIFEGFGDLQQSALEGLLFAAATNTFSDNTEDVELIINGDCFEFLFMEPHEKQSFTYPSTALNKLERVIDGHKPFFQTLQQFISQPGRQVTFMIGNHDVELAFKDVQERISEAICNQQGELKKRVHFCHSHSYRPTPDVLIEHGNQYDFWNRIIDLWDEKGQPLTCDPSKIMLPLGTQYIQRAAYPINVQYPYFDRFEPAMNLTPQIAILSLLNPELIVSTVQKAREMLPYSRTPFTGLAFEENNPVLFFEHSMREFVAFQDHFVAQYPDFIEPLGEAARIDAMIEFATIREALSLPRIEAMKNIFVPTTYRMAESTAQGMQNNAQKDHSVRYAIAGHTHMHRMNTFNSGSQVYLNTGAWTTRYALPGPEEITPELVAWLSKPDWNAVPFRDATQHVFALIQTEEGLPSRVHLCAWQGGEQGIYHVLA